MITSGAALIVVAAVLALLAVTTARRPVRVLPLDGYLHGWQALHGGTEPRDNAFVHGWLRLVFVVTQPVARRGVHPDVVTAAAVWLASLVLLLAVTGGGWLLLAAALLVLTGLLDGVDGCLAVLTERSSRHGHVLDSTADRVAEALWLAALVAAGCPWWLAVAAGLAVLSLEGIRVVAGRVLRITVAEKPTRVLVLAPALALAPLDPILAASGGVVLLALTLVGVVQLAVAR